MPVPQFVPSGAVTTLSLAVPNERPAPMTGLVVTVPDGFHIVKAQPVAGWSAEVDGSTATWSGGPLSHLAIETFLLVVDVSASPGVEPLGTRQLYERGESVSWPAALTVIPGNGQGEDDSSGGGVVLLVVLAILGLVVASGVALLAWRRRAAQPQ